MIKFSVSSLIDRRVEDVFEFMTDIQNAPKWNPDLIDAQKLSEVPANVGTKYRMLYQLPRGPSEHIHEVIVYEPNRKFIIAVTSGPVPINYCYSFQSVRTGTRVSLAVELETEGIAQILASVLTATIKKRMMASFDVLKRLLETAA